MDHDLVAFARRPWLDSVVQRRLGDECERVRFLLLNRRPVRGTVEVSLFRRSVRGSRSLGTVHALRCRGAARGVLRSCPLMQRLPGCRDCLNHHGPRLRLEPRADDHHPVLVVIHMQGAVFVPARRVFRFHLAIDTAPAADNTLDVVSRAGQADLEQALFGLRRRDPRQRPDLRVRQLAARQCLGQPWQRAQRARHADPLARGTHLETDAVAQPMRTREEPVVPASAGIEFADEIEQPRGGGVEVRGELGDLVADAIELDDVRMSRDEVRTIDVHRRLLVLRRL